MMSDFFQWTETIKTILITSLIHYAVLNNQQHCSLNPVNGYDLFIGIVVSMYKLQLLTPSKT